MSGRVPYLEIGSNLGPRLRIPPEHEKHLVSILTPPRHDKIEQQLETVFPHSEDSDVELEDEVEGPATASETLPMPQSQVNQSQLTAQTLIDETPNQSSSQVHMHGTVKNFDWKRAGMAHSGRNQGGQQSRAPRAPAARHHGPVSVITNPSLRSQSQSHHGSLTQSSGQDKRVGLAGEYFVRASPCAMVYTDSSRSTTFSRSDLARHFPWIIGLAASAPLPADLNSQITKLSLPTLPGTTRMAPSPDILLSRVMRTRNTGSPVPQITISKSSPRPVTAMSLSTSAIAK